MLPSFLPKTIPFFEMLEEQNKMLRAVSHEVCLLFSGKSEPEACGGAVARLEAEADQKHRNIVRSLSQTFITPIDREDILRIDQGQEECIDRLQGLVTRVIVSGFDRIRFPASKIVQNIDAMLELTGLMLDGLSKRKDCHKTRVFRSLKEECDSILAVGLAELMDPQGDHPAELIDVIKWSRIYDKLETVLDQVNNLSEALEEAVLKNA